MKKLLLVGVLTLATSCASKKSVELTTSIDNSTRTVANNPQEQLQVGDSVTIKFNRDVEFDKNKTRVVLVNTEVGGIFLDKPYPKDIDARRIDSMIYGYEYHPTSGELKPDRNIPIDGMVFTVVIDLKAADDQKQVIKKGRQITLKLGRDLNIQKGDREAKLNNLIAPKDSAISRIILAGGMYGKSLSTVDDLKDAVTIGELLQLSAYRGVSTAAKVTPKPAVRPVEPAAKEIY